MKTTMQKTITAIGAALLLAGCGTDIPTSNQVGQGVAAFLNAASVKVDVEVNFVVMINAVEPSMPASLEDLFLPPGQHFIRILPAGTTNGGAGFIHVAAEGVRRNIVSYQTPGASINARVLEDTGAIVPAGKSKVRVINLASGSSIDIWRTQPDFQQPTRFQTPFPFNPEPGPYVQSDSGAWHVWITPTNNSTTRLHEVGPINIAGGDKRTVVVVDSAGTLRLRVLRD